MVTKVGQDHKRKNGLTCRVLTPNVDTEILAKNISNGQEGVTFVFFFNYYAPVMLTGAI